MPLVEFNFTLCEIDSMEGDELTGWIEAINLYKLRERVELLKILPFASIQFKDAGRHYNAEMTKLNRDYQVALDLYELQNNKKGWNETAKTLEGKKFKRNGKK